MSEFPAVQPPDEKVRQAALARQLRLTKPAGSLGRLEELGVWASACQGVCPPRPFGRPRVVVFAGDHGIAAQGVSAYPSEVTGQMVANFLAGGAAINVLSAVAGATVRVADLSVTVDTLPEISKFKVRRGSGSIDREDALTEAETEAAITAGQTIADEEIDGGADLLVAGDMGIGNTTPAAVMVAAITGKEPVAVVGRGTGIDRSDVTAALSELESRGLVERSVDPRHKRRNIVTITPAGIAKLQELDQVIDEVQERVLEPLTAAQRRQFIALMGKLLAAEREPQAG